jgi:hypothetical protein
MSTIGGSTPFFHALGTSPSVDGPAGSEGARGREAGSFIGHLPEVATFVTRALGVPELPAADLALMGTDGLSLLAGFLAGESRQESIKPLLESLASRGTSLISRDIARNAAGAFEGDLGQFLKAIAEGAAKAMANDPDGTALLAMEVGRVVATAVATGGASLASDLPALAPKLMTAAAAVLRESGIQVDALMTQIVADLLKQMGVEAATAQTIAQVSVPLLILGGDIALAVASEGKHKIPPERVANAVREIALATGVEPDAAAVVATAGASAFAFGQNFYGYLSGGGDPMAYGGLDQIAEVASGSVKTWMEQGGASPEEIRSTLNQLSPLLQSFLDTVQQDMSGERENATQGWKDLNKTLLGWNPAFGNLFDGINSLNQVIA